MGPFLCLGQGLVPFLGLPIDPSTHPHTHTHHQFGIRSPSQVMWFI